MSVDTIDPFGAPETDELDPFATPEDVKAGSTFEPSPKPEALDGRLVIMIPRRFRSDDLVPEGFRKHEGETRDRYDVDLYVLGNHPLTFHAYVKEDGSEEYVEKEFTIPASDMPKGFRSVRIVQAALVGQLRRISGTPRPVLMGIMRRGPQARDRGRKTFDSIGAEHAEWVRKGKRGQEPRFSWQIDADVTPDQRKMATDWWAANSRDIPPVGQVEDVTGKYNN